MRERSMLPSYDMMMNVIPQFLNLHVYDSATSIAQVYDGTKTKHSLITK
jgi:hypothetical protein